MAQKPLTLILRSKACDSSSSSMQHAHYPQNSAYLPDCGLSLSFLCLSGFCTTQLLMAVTEGLETFHQKFDCTL